MEGNRVNHRITSEQAKREMGIRFIEEKVVNGRVVRVDVEGLFCREPLEEGTNLYPPFCIRQSGSCLGCQVLE